MAGTVDGAEGEQQQYAFCWRQREQGLPLAGMVRHMNKYADWYACVSLR